MEEIEIKSMQLCGYTLMPEHLNSPQFMHPLNGNSFQLIGNYNLNDILFGAFFKVKIPQTSMLVFYLETPIDLKTQAELSKLKGTHKLIASSDNLNYGNDNFLHSKSLLR